MQNAVKKENMMILKGQKDRWHRFSLKHPKAAKWLYQLFYFWVFSMGVTILQYLMFTFLPYLFGTDLAGVEFMWPKLPVHILGYDYNWNILGYEIKSHGNISWQIFWYFIAWGLISLICNGINGLWMPIAQQHFAPAVYNLLVTFITGGVSMVIYFFAYKIIFPEGESKK